MFLLVVPTHPQAPSWVSSSVPLGLPFLATNLHGVRREHVDHSSGSCTLLCFYSIILQFQHSLTLTLRSGFHRLSIDIRYFLSFGGRFREIDYYAAATVNSSLKSPFLNLLLKYKYTYRKHTYHRWTAQWIFTNRKLPCIQLWDQGKELAHTTEPPCAPSRHCPQG